MRRRGPLDVVQVELVDADDDAALAGPGSRPEDSEAEDAARARRLRWVGLAVVAILLGTILTATVIDGRRDAARRAAWAELDWVLPPLDGPLEEVWRVSGGWVSGMSDDVLVVHDPAGSSVRGLDAATGTTLWERDSAGEDCFPVQDYRSTDRSRYLMVDTLVCVPFSAYLQMESRDGVTTYVVASGADERGEVVYGAPLRSGATTSIVAVDLASGAEVGSLVVDGGLLAQDSVDADVLVTSIDADGSIGVVRWHPRVGEVWSYRSPPGVLGDDAPFWNYYGRTDGAVWLSADLALDLETGREVPAEPLVDTLLGGQVQHLPDGGRVEWEWEPASSAWDMHGRVLNADGSLRFEVDGTSWTSNAADGSLDAILTLRATGEVVALEPDSGGELWSAPGMSAFWPNFLLAEILVAVGPTTVAALDAHDGTLLWQVDTRWASNTVPPTDGDVVLIQIAEVTGPVIVAIDLRTGEEAWRMPGARPGSYWELLSVADLFVLVDDDGIVALR